MLARHETERPGSGVCTGQKERWCFMNTIMTASNQWASRPDDQRFLTLDDLHASVKTRKEHSWTVTPKVETLRMVPVAGEAMDTGPGGLSVEVYDPTAGEKRELALTHWSFNQLSQYAGAPAAYMRKLPAPLAAINMQWGLEHNPVREDALLLAHSNGDNLARAFTSTTYGRIWDQQVVEAVQKANGDGRWVVPAASYTTTNPKRATTLYASDRDVFIFLVDPKNEIEVRGEKLYRGFITWNSEVGSAVFGLTTFLYRYICDNRIVWGATDVKELRIRHTGGAVDRFAYEGEKYLQKYAAESTATLVTSIEKAKDFDLESKVLNTGKGDTVESWLQSRGFSKGQAKASVETAVAEEGQARTLWDVINGITAYARSVSRANERVELETAAGQLMNYTNN